MYVYIHCNSAAARSCDAAYMKSRCTSRRRIIAVRRPTMDNATVALL